MAKIIPDKMLDVRVVHRYQARGQVSDKDLQSHLKNLPDLDGKYEEMHLEEFPIPGGNGEAKPQ
ncbi:MAG: hypothetical protein ABIJ09_24970 [Pseudomonadota bacterium]